MANDSFLGLDVGAQRIGVAIARADVRIAGPLTTLENTPEIMADISTLVADHHISQIVVGLPRGVHGQHTDQTRWVESFVQKLRPHIHVPIVLQDEALTSVKAEDELKARKKPYTKADVDALAATYILEDFLNDPYAEAPHA